MSGNDHTNGHANGRDHTENSSLESPEQPGVDHRAEESREPDEDRGEVRVYSGTDFLEPRDREKEGDVDSCELLEEEEEEEDEHRLPSRGFTEGVDLSRKASKMASALLAQFDLVLLYDRRERDLRSRKLPTLRVRLVQPSKVSSSILIQFQ